MQKAIDYIEDNLKKELDIQTIADHTFYSITHFYRIFQAHIGDSVKSYIQKRRLSHAATEILKTNRRLIDIAFDYQYNSQEVFTRAFQNAFGITPGKYRVDQPKIILYEKAIISPNQSELLKNYIEPIVILDTAFNLIGMKDVVKPSSVTIKNLWNNFNIRKLEISGVIKPELVYGVCEYKPNITDESEFTYFAGVEVKQCLHVPKGFIKKTIPVSKYAVFKHKGPIFELKNTYNYIYGIWLASSGYELAELDTLEVYNLNSHEPIFDIYIPLKFH